MLKKSMLLKSTILLITVLSFSAGLDSLNTQFLKSAGYAESEVFSLDIRETAVKNWEMYE